MTEIIRISTPFIKLDQFLKFSGIVEMGCDAKFLVQEGYVMVNGETELRRGKKLVHGDKVFVDYEGQQFSLEVEKE